MKKIICLIFMCVSMVMTGQENIEEVPEPIAYVRACMQAALKPRVDTLACYPGASGRWLPVIDQYIKELQTKLGPEAGKNIHTEQDTWLKTMETVFRETDLIIQNENKTLPERRQAAIRQFRFAEERALYLKKQIAGT